MGLVRVLICHLRADDSSTSANYQGINLGLSSLRGVLVCGQYSAG